MCILRNLEMISDRNNGEISTDELGYIQYSLTGIELDFSSYGPVNRYDDASALNYGSISGWEYEDTEDGVIVTARLEVGTEGTEWTQERELTINLVKNPQSCFGGYSVLFNLIQGYNFISRTGKRHLCILRSRYDGGK